MAVYTHLFLIAQIQTQLSEVEDGVVGNAEQLSSLPTAPPPHWHTQALLLTDKDEMSWPFLATNII